jgi:hypothetical protein
VPISNANHVFPVFIGVWIALAVFSGAFFFLNSNAALKRKVWPPFAIATGVLFVGFVWAMGLPTTFFIVIILVVELITLLNFRAMKFCDACGRTLMHQNPFFTPQFCSKCGAKLKQ